MTSESLQQLARRIQEIETAQRPTLAPAILLGIPLPGGLPAGALVELLSTAAGGGAWTLALLLAKAACGQRKMLVVADAQRAFYPPAAAVLGIDLQRTLIVRAKGPASLVQALRCPAVGAAIGCFERLTSAEYRSLQLAAEAGGGVGFLVRPAAALGAPSFAALRLLVTPRPAPLAARLLDVEILRVRGGKAGQRLVLEIDHETGDVRVPAGLAAATPVARSA